MEKKYSLSKGVQKALIGLVVFGIPVLIDMFPDVANLTIGAVLMLLVNFIKIKTS